MSVDTKEKRLAALSMSRPLRVVFPASGGFTTFSGRMQALYAFPVADDGSGPPPGNFGHIFHNALLINTRIIRSMEKSGRVLRKHTPQRVIKETS